MLFRAVYGVCAAPDTIQRCFLGIQVAVVHSVQDIGTQIVVSYVFVRLCLQDKHLVVLFDIWSIAVCVFFEKS